MSARHPLLAVLQRRVDLTPSERQAVEAVPVRLATAEADQTLLRKGDRPRRCVLVTGGLLCRSKIVSTGGRQITAFHIPGDIPDLHGLHLEVLDGDLWAVAPSTLAFLDLPALRSLCERVPRVAAELWRTTLVHAAIHREWTVSLGQRPAATRLAHLFCEILTRMEAMGLAQGDACAFPVTQGDLSEATGLSPVHLNRTLQALRAEGLLTFEAGRLAVLDREALVERGDFEPTYLHLAERR